MAAGGRHWKGGNFVASGASSTASGPAPLTFTHAGQPVTVRQGDTVTYSAEHYHRTPGLGQITVERIGAGGVRGTRGPVLTPGDV